MFIFGDTKWNLNVVKCPDNIVLINATGGSVIISVNPGATLTTPMLLREVQRIATLLTDSQKYNECELDTLLFT